MKHATRQFSFSVARSGAALLAMAALLSSTFAIASNAESPGKAKAQSEQTANSLNEDQRILHVLNRLGFGARPGDVARVKAMGLTNYINLQLNPRQISDALADSKLKDLPTLNMTTAQLYEKYPQPALLLRRLQERGELPPALAAARDNRAKRGEPQPGAAMETKAENVDAKKDVAKPAELADLQNDPKYRQALREYYQQNGLQLPQRIAAELQASRILRAVYSERQLQEVMVDFWSNHFNVFAGKGADRWLLVSYDRDTIRPNVLGKFSDLLVATAQSPAMLFYLDNFQSVSPNAQLGPTPGRGGSRPTPRPAWPVSRPIWCWPAWSWCGPVAPSPTACAPSPGPKAPTWWRPCWPPPVTGWRPSPRPVHRGNPWVTASRPCCCRPTTTA